MLRKTFLALFAVLLMAASSEAAIILSQSAPTPLNGGLVGIDISAVGTSGEVINTFTNPVLAAGLSSVGVHNVAQAFTSAGTPTVTQHQAGLWNDAWTPYDTYFTYGGTDLALDLGTAMSETNDGSTSGTLGLPTTPAAPTSGFGTISSAASTTKVLVPGLASSSVTFMHVVLRAQDTALLSVEVTGNGGQADQFFNNYVVGSTPIVPEPATLSLLGLAMVGGLGLIRRRRA